MTLLLSDNEYVEEQSSSSSDEESKTLAAVELKKRNSKGRSVANGSPKTHLVTRGRKRKASPNVLSSAKKQQQKKKASSMTDDADKKHSSSFSPEELLLVSRAFMKVSNNAKHDTDKKADKFWDDINEANIEYTQMEHCNAESLCNCWQRRLAPAVQKFAGIVSQNKPLSGKVVGDNLMDLYFQRMQEIYASK